MRQMGIVENASQLGTTELRKMLISIIESGLFAIQPESVFASSFHFHDPQLVIKEKEYNLAEFERVFLIGIGKGSAHYAKMIEDLLGQYLYAGHVIDVTPENFSTVHYTRGSHPLPSSANHHFTRTVLSKFQHLSERDLVLVLICGGGSAMLVDPAKISLDQLIGVNQALLKSGADIFEMNTVRKHLSYVKAGGLAIDLYPAQVASLIFSDVPGNDLSFIASGPTVRDDTSIEDAKKLINKYNLFRDLEIEGDVLVETPKEDKYFETVDNILVLSNLTALEAMEERGQELGLSVKQLSDKLQGEAREVGAELVSKLEDKTLLLAGGETTVTVKGEGGKGGRNLEVALGALEHVGENDIVTSIASDGYDNTEFAGGIADNVTQKHAQEKSLTSQEFLEANNSFAFFEASGDGIMTGRLPSNVADLFIALRHG